MREREAWRALEGVWACGKQPRGGGRQRERAGRPARLATPRLSPPPPQTRPGHAARAACSVGVLDERPWCGACGRVGKIKVARVAT